MAVCQTCLANDRLLTPLRNIEILLKDFTIRVTDGGLCWECRSVLIKLCKFKSQVLLAQVILNDSVQTKCNIKSLSKLTCTHTETHDFKYGEDPLNNNDRSGADEDVDINDENNASHNDHQDDHDKIGDKINESSLYVDELNTTGNANDTNDKLNKTKKTKLTVSEINSNDNTFSSDDDKPVQYLKIPKTTKPQYSFKNISNQKIKQKSHSDDDHKEIDEKFVKVLLTKEDITKRREEKRNGPNFKKIPYKCDSCVLGFLKEDTYKMHMDKKHSRKVGEHSCTICQTRFSSASGAARHERRHYEQYHCSMCRYQTAEKWSALSHCRSKHARDTPSTIHCPQCPEICSSASQLSEHLSSHTVSCAQCGDTFKGPGTLRSHTRRVHAAARRRLRCGQCGRTFCSRSRLETHAARHGGAAGAGAGAYCVQCRVQYKSVHVYRNHLANCAAHANNCYECSVCKKKFASKVYWKRHYEFFHLQKTKHKCPDCGKLFMSSWSLRSHAQTRHGEPRARDFACNVCGRTFYTSSTLKGHQLTHSAQRSFLCAECGDSFRQRPSLYTHVRLVHRGHKRRGRANLNLNNLTTTH